MLLRRPKRETSNLPLDLYYIEYKIREVILKLAQILIHGTIPIWAESSTGEGNS